MGVFDDYITSLEGRENIDPLEVASKLHELHSQELGTREAKIAEYESTVAEKDTALAEKDQEILTWKARNFDLASQIPGGNTDPSDNVSDEDPSSITVNDLFQK